MNEKVISFTIVYILIIFTLFSGCIEKTNINPFQIDEIYYHENNIGIHCFSPDNEKILLRLVHKPDRHDQDLWVMNIDGTQLENIYHPQNYLFNVHFSPDGNNIIFSEYNKTSSKIISIDFYSKQIKELALGTDPMISPRGDKIIYRFDKGIWIMDIDGNNCELVTEYGDDPIFFPEGNKVLFLETTGSFNLTSMDLDGSNKINILSLDVPIYDFSISPGGSHILFNSDYEYDGTYISYTTYLYEISSEDLTQIDKENEFQQLFAFHPNHPIITYTNKEEMSQNSPIEICVRNYNGDQNTFISKDGMDSRSLFSPDGLKIAYTHQDRLGEGYILSIAHDDTGKWGISF